VTGRGRLINMVHRYATARSLMRILILFLTILLTACLSNPPGEVPNSLAQQVRTFEDVVRWGALPKMYLFQKHDPDEVVTIPDNLDNVRVTNYEIASRLSEVAPLRWTQTAVIDYVLIDRQVVRQLADEQVWQSDDEGQSWYRTNPMPQFH